MYVCIKQNEVSLSLHYKTHKNKHWIETLRQHHKNQYIQAIWIFKALLKH